MSETIEVRVPDIGDFKDVPVIEVLVKSGDRVKKNDSLITLESEKASMEVPAEVDGVVQDVKVKVGDKVSEGASILTLSAGGRRRARRSAATCAAPRRNPRTAPARNLHRPQPPPRSPRRHATGRCTPDRRFAGSRASSASICATCAAADRTAASRARTCRSFVKGALQRGERRGRRRSPGCRRGRRSTSRSTGRSSAARSRASRSSPGRTCIATGCRFRTSPTTTKPTSPRSKRFETKSTPSRRRASGPKLTMLAFLSGPSIAALQRFPEFNASLDGDELDLQALLQHRLRGRHARTGSSCRSSRTPTRRACSRSRARRRARRRRRARGS